MIKIRMTRAGRVNAPIYTIVAADSKSPRDGKFLAKLGQYNPNGKPELVNVKAEEITEWVSKGAQLSDTVRTLLKKHNIKVK